jgi:16S rRNA (cytidine1402-2'-O)-methyltransferase
MSATITLPVALYIVATPIGNLDDITRRAVSVLASVDLCCAEDTRHSRRLMEHLGIAPKLMSVHEHNERERGHFIVSLLEQGQSVALIIDAGTPLIYDPGYHLVQAVVDAGYVVHPVPGVSAVIAALSVAGLPTDHWRFEGFLPAKSTARQKTLKGCADSPHTLVFYESSHRILASLKDMVSVYGGQRRVAVARELTKTFETVLRGSLDEVVAMVMADANQQKGEFVVMVAGESRPNEAVGLDPIALAQVLGPLVPPRQAAAAMVELIGGRKKAWYDIIIGLHKSD